MAVKHAMVPLSNCPTCGYEHDCATCIEEDGAVPRPGDATICIKCGEFLVFGDDLKLRLPTEEEYREVGMNPRIVAAQIVVRGSAGRPDHLK